MNPDVVHNSCDIPQELSDHDIDKSINKVSIWHLRVSP